jgi:hypothetical protein
MQPSNGSCGIISGNLKMSYPRLMEMASLSPNITRGFVPSPCFFLPENPEFYNLYSGVKKTPQMSCHLNSR